MFRSKRKNLHHTRGRARVGVKVLLLLVFFGLLGFFFVYLPVTRIKAQADRVILSARAAKESFSNNNIDEMKSKVSQLQKDYDELEARANKIYWAGHIPIFGAYVKDFKNGIEAGDELIEAGRLAVEAIAPHADLLGFKKGETSFVDKPADERIATAVKTLDTILDDVDQIAVHIDRARKNIEQIDQMRYPNKIAGKKVREKIKNVKNQFEGVASLFVDAKPLIKKLPEILGSDDREKIYLVIFQNNTELRPTGGFWTAYAIFRVQNGKFRVERSEDIYHLDAAIASHPKAPREILTYHKGVSIFNIRDSNLSPDFVKSLELFNSLYEKSANKVDYDGVFAVDTNVLVDILNVLGPTEVNGIVFTTQKHERCDCPQVIYKLLDEIDRPVGFVKENRKGLLGDLLFVIMQKALGFSPSQYWGKLTQQFVTNLQEKHILVYLNDKDAQKAIEAINFGGRIRQFKGDYLHINDTNFAGAKSNLFTDHEIDSETAIMGDGTVEKTVTINYKNPYRHSSCDLESGALCLNATLRNWLRVYVPKGSELIDFKGSEMKVQTYDELGKTVFEGFLNVKPQGKATVIIKYQLPFKVNKESDYKLLIQKQPGAKDHQFTISVNGTKRAEFNLVEDRVFQLD